MKRTKGKKKKIKYSKRTSQIKHAQKRFKHRYGITLSKEQYNDMLAQIHQGKAEFICKDTHRISKFWVMIEGMRVPVVYDRTRKSIVTVLLPQWVEETSDSDSQYELHAQRI